MFILTKFFNLFQYTRNLLFLIPSQILLVIKSRRIRWAGHVTRMGEKKNAHKSLVGNHERKKPIGIHRRR